MSPEETAIISTDKSQLEKVKDNVHLEQQKQFEKGSKYAEIEQIKGIRWTATGKLSRILKN